MSKKSRQKEKSRLDRLAGQNLALKKKQEALQKQCKKLRKKQKLLSAGYQSVGKKAKGLHAALSELQQENRRLAERMVQEDRRSRKIRGRLDRLKSRQGADRKKVTALSQHLDQQEKLASALSERLEDVEQLALQGDLLREQLEYLHADKAELDAQISSLITHIIGLKDGQEGFASHIGKLSGALDEVLRRAGEQLEQYRALEERLGDLNQGNRELQRQTDQQKTQAADLKERLSAVEQRLASQIVAVEDKLQHLETEYDRLLQEELTQHQGQIQGLLQKADAIDQTARTGADLARSLHEGYGSLQERLAATEEYPSRWDAELEKRLAQLDAHYRQLLEESRKQQRKMMDGLIENLNRAEAGLTQKVDLQKGQIAKLAQNARKLDEVTVRTAETSQSLQKHMIGFRDILISAVKRLARNDAVLNRDLRKRDLEYQYLAGRHDRLVKSLIAAGALILLLGGVGLWLLYDRLASYPDAAAGQETIVAEQMLPVQNEQVEKNANRIALFEKTYDETRKQLEQTRKQMEALAAWQEQFKQETGQQEEPGQPAENTQQEHNTIVQPAPGKAVSPESAIHDAAWLQKRDPHHYTVQVIAAHEPASVTRVARRKDLPEAKAIYRKTGFSRRDWYVLLYGDFPSFREARAAMSALPEDVRAYSPWIRKLSDVQDDLAAP